MRTYRKFCETIGMSPVWYAVACVVGALGWMGCMLLQKMKGYEGASFWCLPPGGVPFLMVMFSVDGTQTERFGKMLYGNLVTAFLSFFPGGVIGALLGEWLFG